MAHDNYNTHTKLAAGSLWNLHEGSPFLLQVTCKLLCFLRKSCQSQELSLKSQQDAFERVTFSLHFATWTPQKKSLGDVEV